MLQQRKKRLLAVEKAKKIKSQFKTAKVKFGDPNEEPKNLSRRQKLELFLFGAVEKMQKKQKKRKKN